MKNTVNVINNFKNIKESCNFALQSGRPLSLHGLCMTALTTRIRYVMALVCTPMINRRVYT